MDTKLHVQIEVQSPISLSSGQADVTVDADVIHDEYGLPYFPAKRFKGLLYESALEVAEMSELCGGGILEVQTVAELFGRIPHSPVQLILHDFHFDEYEDMVDDLSYLERTYSDCFCPSDVLAEYTSLRYQTSIDGETGTAADASLHNMRVVDAGVVFAGDIELQGAETAHIHALELALQNLRSAGLKRNRGFGKIKCIIGTDPVKPKLSHAVRTEKALLEDVTGTIRQKAGIDAEYAVLQKEKWDKKNKSKKNTGKNKKRKGAR